MRTMIKVACEPGSVGAMCAGNSPNDPIFWVIHPIMEKALHVLELAPNLRDGYTFEWVNGTCDGSRIYDEVPFTGEMSKFPRYRSSRCAVRGTSGLGERACRGGCLERRCWRVDGAVVCVFRLPCCACVPPVTSFAQRPIRIRPGFIDRSSPADDGPPRQWTVSRLTFGGSGCSSSYFFVLLAV